MNESSNQSIHSFSCMRSSIHSVENFSLLLVTLLSVIYFIATAFSFSRFIILQKVISTIILNQKAKRPWYYEAIELIVGYV